MHMTADRIAPRTAVAGRADLRPALPVRAARIWTLPRFDPGSALIACFLIALSDILFALGNDRLQHWFLVPVSVCGVLMATDAVEWIRGRLDLYDPVGIIGLYTIHWFYLAPILNVKWDFFISDVAAPPDWRDWLGYMAVLNAIGLIGYRLCRSLFRSKAKTRTITFWKIDKAKARFVLPAAIMVSAVAQTAVYIRFGGIGGYIDSRLDDPNAWTGLGPLFMISESAPILIAFFVVVMMQARKINWGLASLALAMLCLVQMYFGGLRGSRSETVELFFWVVGCIHLLIHPVPRRMIYIGCLFLYAFMYFYNFYKAMGKNATEAYTASAEDREYLARKTNKTAKGVLLGDFGRADVQAYILFRAVTDGKDLDYANGRTYLGALSIWVPRFILPERPESKLKEGTEFQYGSGYDPKFPSSRVYGIATESILNFGPVAAPVTYALLGLFVGWFRRAVGRFLPGDARLLLVPLVVYECMSCFGGDSDNLVFGIAKNSFLPLLAIVLFTARRRVRVGAAGTVAAVRA
jgi:hypothetical protein